MATDTPTPTTPETPVSQVTTEAPPPRSMPRGYDAIRDLLAVQRLPDAPAADPNEPASEEQVAATEDDAAPKATPAAQALDTEPAARDTEKDQTPATPSAAPADATASDAKPAEQAKAQEAPADDQAAAPAESPPSAAKETPPATDSAAAHPASPETPEQPKAEAGTQEPAPSEAPDPLAAFTSREWQQAFRVDPALRRTAARIQGDPSLTLDQKAERLATKLSDALQKGREAQDEAARLRQLRKDDPDAYIAAIEEQEASQEADTQLALKVSRFIATALEADPDDPDYLAAGPREGESYEVGLQRFAEWTVEHSPLVQAREARLAASKDAEWQAKLEAVQAEHKAALATQKKELEEAHQVAVEQARAEARAAAASPPPRSGPPGPGMGTLPQRLPDLATIRSLMRHPEYEMS